MTSKSCFFGRSAVIAVCTAVCILTGAGCNLSDTGPSAHRPPDQFFAEFALEHHAINLSMVPPYDTVTLHTISSMADGSAVPGEVTYSISSPSLSITDGVLKAVSPVSRAIVRVTLTYGTNTRTDSAFVSVIAGAPNPLSDFGLRLAAGDSAKTGTNVTKRIPFRRVSESGSNLSTLLVSTVSSDSTVASMTLSGTNMSITAKRPGRVVLSTSTFAYGTTWRDSLVFTVGWPTVFNVPTTARFTTGSMATVLDFGYREFTIGLGGCVVWVNASKSVDLDIQFEDPSHVVARTSACGPLFQTLDFYPDIYPALGGNIEPFRSIPFPVDESAEGFEQEYIKAFFSLYRARVFSAPGVYHYRSTLHGTTGLVRVCDEANDTTCAPTGLGGWY